MKTMGRNLEDLKPVALSKSHVEALQAAGTVGHYTAGTFVVQPGDYTDQFFYIDDREIELVNCFTNERHVLRKHRVNVSI